MRLEELRIKWKQLGLQDFLDARKINLRILDPRMIAVDQQRSQSKERKKEKILELQTLGSVDGLHTFSEVMTRIVHPDQGVTLATTIRLISRYIGGYCRNLPPGYND